MTLDCGQREVRNVFIREAVGMQQIISEVTQARSADDSNLGSEFRLVQQVVGNVLDGLVRISETRESMSSTIKRKQQVRCCVCLSCLLLRFWSVRRLTQQKLKDRTAKKMCDAFCFHS